MAEDTDFVAFDLNASGPASDPVSSPVSASVAEEQLQAYQKCFELLQEELKAIEERHKNDVLPADSEATKELKAVRAELEELKKSLSSVPQYQQQPQFAQPQIVPQYQQPIFGGLSIPYMATPTIQPTIPNMLNHKI